MRFASSCLTLALMTSCSAAVDFGAAFRPVPPHPATYVVSPATVPLGRAPSAVLTNTAPLTALEFGSPFFLERRIGQQWKLINGGCAFTSEALDIAPGASFRQKLSTCDYHGRDRKLVPGLYRVIKNVSIEGNSHLEQLREVANFRITKT